MRSSGRVCGWLATGSETSMPRLIIGAVTMKTSSSTSTTSTSGVTLISPMHGAARGASAVCDRSRPRATAPPPLPAPAACIYVKLRSTMLRNSRAKSSIIDESTLMRLL